MNKRRNFFTKLAAVVGLGSLFSSANAHPIIDTNAPLGSSANPYIGQINVFGFNFPPVGWAKCDGQLLPIAQNSALFSLLGTMYGGDGQTTFGLPDLRGRCALHHGQGPGLSYRSQGQTVGTENSTLTVNNLPAHSHGGATKVSANKASSANPDSGYVLAQNDNLRFIDAASGGTLQSLNTSTDNTGGGTSFNNMQPSLTLNYCIALVGTFPSQN